MNHRVTVCFACALSAGAAAAACRTPGTDIVATSTEAVGGFSMAGTVADAAYRGHVCVSEPNAADEIARRIVQQLENHNFTGITLDVYSERAPVARFVWSSGHGLARAGEPPQPNPCGGPAVH